jgi:hypothetical protein
MHAAMWRQSHFLGLITFEIRCVFFFASFATLRWQAPFYREQNSGFPRAARLHGLTIVAD